MKAASLAVVAIFVAGAASAGACTSKTNSDLTAPSPEGPFEIAVSKVDDPFQPADPFNAPPAASRYVAVHLRISNVSALTQTVEPAVDFKIIGALGISYDVAVVVAQPGDISAGGPSLGVLAPGSELEGLLPFVIPISDSPRLLVFQRPGARIEVALPQGHLPETTTPQAR